MFIQGITLFASDGTEIEELQRQRRNSWRNVHLSKRSGRAKLRTQVSDAPNQMESKMSRQISVIRDEVTSLLDLLSKTAICRG